MRTFSFDHMDSTQFEQFCYDLLSAMEFTNLNWRKGTGLSASPSDSGRDIECERLVDDIDGRKRTEKWFVECKHYKEGVPPAAFQGALAWANAEGPDVLLIIVSNFLSNPAKDNLAQYEANNRPRFRIKFWEKPELEKLTAGKSLLLRKYELTGNFPYVSIIHPVHLAYIKAFSLNTLDYFFATLDSLDSTKRDQIMSWAYHMIIRPRRRPLVTGKEKMRDLYIDEVSYSAFRSRCSSIAASDLIDQVVLVFSVVSLTLQSQFAISDITGVDALVAKLDENIRLYEEEAAKAEPDHRKSFDRIIKDQKHRKENATSMLQENYDLYVYFCENVVARLLEEDIWTHIRDGVSARSESRVNHNRAAGL